MQFIHKKTVDDVYRRSYRVETIVGTEAFMWLRAFTNVFFSPLRYVLFGLGWMDCIFSSYGAVPFRAVFRIKWVQKRNDRFEMVSDMVTVVAYSYLLIESSARLTGKFS